jgi:hypothetical protein
MLVQICNNSNLECGNTARVTYYTSSGMMRPRTAGLEHHVHVNLVRTRTTSRPFPLICLGPEMSNLGDGLLDCCSDSSPSKCYSPVQYHATSAIFVPDEAVPPKTQEVLQRLVTTVRISEIYSY